jgi:hypothetical protein
MKASRRRALAKRFRREKPHRPSQTMGPFQLRSKEVSACAMSMRGLLNKGVGKWFRMEAGLRTPLPLGPTQTPAHDARRDGGWGHIRWLAPGGTLIAVEEGRLAGGLAVDQASGTARVEPHHPVTYDLKGDTAEARSISWIDASAGSRRAGLASFVCRQEDAACRPQ